MLRWDHDWGTKAEHFEMLHGIGRRVPDDFVNRPEMLPVAAFYWAAFCELGTERQIGMVVGPIPRSKARDYALEHGIEDRDEFAAFWHIVSRLDGEASRIRRPRDGGEEELREKVSAKDTKGVRRMMQNLGRKPRQ